MATPPYPSRLDPPIVKRAQRISLLPVSPGMRAKSPSCCPLCRAGRIAARDRKQAILEFPKSTLEVVVPLALFSE